MGFIFGVLVIGALLAAIFGRGVAQLFVIGTATIISWIVIGVSLFILSGLVYAHFHAPPVYTPTSLGDPTVNTYVPPGGGLADSPPSTPVAQAAPSYAPPAQSYAPPAQPERRPFDNVYNPMTGGTAGDPPTIGVEMLPLAPADEGRLGLAHGSGVYLSSVHPGGPADIAGLRTGDVVTTMDGQAITRSNELPGYEARRGAGQPISLFVYRIANGRMFKGPIMVTPR